MIYPSLTHIFIVAFRLFSDRISYATQIKRILLQLCGSSIGFKPAVKDFSENPMWHTNEHMLTWSLARSFRSLEILKPCTECHIWRKMGQTHLNEVEIEFSWPAPFVAHATEANMYMLKNKIWLKNEPNRVVARERTSETSYKKKRI